MQRHRLFDETITSETSNRKIIIHKEAVSNITGNEIKSLVTGIENGLGFNN